MKPRPAQLMFGFLCGACVFVLVAGQFVTVIPSPNSERDYWVFNGIFGGGALVFALLTRRASA